MMLPQFRVPWIDDTGNSRVNRGFRVQFSSSLGPYMGGLRFHRDTTHGTCKFLAFETIFRNALAGPFGAAHGGSDFNPDGKSEAEVMRFCQSYMTELANYIGPHTDVPTAGVGVGSKEIGYMFGQYKRLRQMNPGGSDGILSGVYYYPEVTGFGIVHFANAVLEARGESLKGKRCLISGSGTVALNVAQKLLDLGAIPIGLSDIYGYVIEPEGFSEKDVEELKRIKTERSARLGGYIMSSTSALYHPTEEGSVWETPCDYAFPCAIQNDITAENVKTLVKNGCKGVFEGANFPCTDDVSCAQLLLLLDCWTSRLTCREWLLLPGDRAHQAARAGVRAEQGGQQRLVRARDQEPERSRADSRGAGHDRQGCVSMILVKEMGGGVIVTSCVRCGCRLHERAARAGVDDGRGVQLPRRPARRRQHLRVHEGRERHVRPGRRVNTSCRQVNRVRRGEAGRGDGL